MKGNGFNVGEDVIKNSDKLSIQQVLWSILTFESLKSSLQLLVEKCTHSLAGALVVSILRLFAQAAKF